MEVHLDAETEAKLSRVAAARFGADRARRTALEIVKAADSQSTMPNRGPGPKSGTREIYLSGLPSVMV